MQKGTRLVYSTTRNILSRYTRTNSPLKSFHWQSKALSTVSAAGNVGPRKFSFASFKHSDLTWKRHFATGKDLRFATEARNLMLKGVDSLADAVEVP
jgi:hypothetical protein